MYRRAVKDEGRHRSGGTRAAMKRGNILLDREMTVAAGMGVRLIA